MVALLVAVGLGWSAELLVQATLPLLILDRGGDASLVGLVAGVYAIPSLVMRPVIGRRIDRVGHGLVHQIGAALLAIAPLGYLVPSAVVLPFARLGQGLGWAMYGTANNFVLVRLAPPMKRGQASGYFNVMWALGLLCGPPIGLALYAGVGREAPFVVASLFAAAGLITATILRRLTPAVHLDAARSTGETGAGNRLPTSRVRRGIGTLLEPTAVPTMLILAAFMAGQTLFFSFAPVYARAIGEPDQVLSWYFPIYGVVLVLGQLLTGRGSDRFGRRRTIILGSCLGAIGLMVAAVGGTWTLFTFGGACFALAAAIVLPATAAATIDRVPPDRAGVGMATFSMGYAIAAGIGGATWGVLIDAHGFLPPFVAAIALQGMCVALAVRFLSAGPSGDVAQVRGAGTTR